MNEFQKRMKAAFDKMEAIRKKAETEKRAMTAEEIEEVFDVSPVIFAAFNDTSVALRKMEENKPAAPTDGDTGEDAPMDIAAIAEEDSLYRKIKGIEEDTVNE